jgi:hypothetical protein
MPFALTCACGAHLEIDDKFAGQQITCPDCQRLLQTPGGDQPVRRTSGLALASILLALIGAFTIIGTLAAVLLGVLALVQMGGRSDRLAGRGYAIAGILIGLVMTGGTLFAISSVELFGISSIVSDAYWQGKLDYDGPMEIVRDREGFAITRPSAKWGLYKPPSTNPFDNHVRDDLLLVRPDEDAVVLCIAEPVDEKKGIEQCRERAEQILRGDRFGLFTKQTRGVLPSPPQVVKTDRPTPVNGVEMVDMWINKKAGSEDKTFLVRVLKKRGDTSLFIVVAGTRRTQFNRVEPELREALNSFRILDPNARRD